MCVCVLVCVCVGLFCMCGCVLFSLHVIMEFWLLPGSGSQCMRSVHSSRHTARIRAPTQTPHIHTWIMVTPRPHTNHHPRPHTIRAPTPHTSSPVVLRDITQFSVFTYSGPPHEQPCSSRRTVRSTGSLPQHREALEPIRDAGWGARARCRRTGSKHGAIKFVWVDLLLLIKSVLDLVNQIYRKLHGNT